MAVGLAWPVLVTVRWFTTGRFRVFLREVEPVLQWFSILGWTVFLLHYTDSRWFTRRAVSALVALPVVLTPLFLTIPYHGRVLRNTRIATDPVVHVAVDRGVGFVPLAVVAYAFILYNFGTLLRIAYRSRNESRTQSLSLAGGVGLVLTLSVAQSTAVVPYDEWVRYIALGQSILSLSAAYGLFGGNLLSARPVTRRDIMAAIDDAVVAVGPGGEVLDHNRAAAHLFPGLDQRGTTLRAAAPELLADGAATTDDAADVTTVADGGRVDGSDVAPDPGTDAGDTGDLDLDLVDSLELSVDGQRRSLVVESSAVGNGGRVVVVRDVTEVEAYAADLERQTEQLDRFAGVVSHDLRNPLSVASTYLETGMGAVDGPEREYLTEVAAAHERMERIIDDALTLARQGQVIEETERVRLDAVITEAARSVDGPLTVESQAGDTALTADASRLRTLLENLLRNAVEHGSTGSQTESGDASGTDLGVTVTVGTTPDGFYVADDGPGIPEEHRDQVFEEGFTTDQDGTGFGLAIVDSVAGAHDWSVAVTESYAGGARFEFSEVDLVEPRRRAVSASE